MNEFWPKTKKEAFQLLVGSIAGAVLIIGYAWGIMAIGFMLGVE